MLAKEIDLKFLMLLTMAFLVLLNVEEPPPKVMKGNR